MESLPFTCHSDPWRDVPWQDALDAVADLGFPAVERFDAFFEEFEEKTELAQDALNRRNLRFEALTRRYDIVDPENRRELLAGVARTAGFLRAVRASFLIVETGTRQEFQSTLQDFRVAAETLNEMAKRCSDYDLAFCIQPKAGDRIESEEEIDRIMNEVDTRDVFLCPDVGGLKVAELDPARILKIYGSCVRRVCFSDVPKPLEPEALEEGILERDFCPPGLGTIDFKEIANVLHSLGYKDEIVLRFDPGEKEPGAELKRTKKYIENIFERGDER